MKESSARNRGSSWRFQSVESLGSLARIEFVVCLLNKEMEMEIEMEIEIEWEMETGK